MKTEGVQVVKGMDAERHTQDQIEAIIASLAQPDPAAPKLPTPDEIRDFVTGVSLALDKVTKIIDGMKSGAVTRKQRESMREIIGEIKNSLYSMALELKLATRPSTERPSPEINMWDAGPARNMLRTPVL